jgi:hypothetical protein
VQTTVTPALPDSTHIAILPSTPESLLDKFLEVQGPAASAAVRFAAKVPANPAGRPLRRATRSAECLAEPAADRHGPPHDCQRQDQTQVVPALTPLVASYVGTAIAPMWSTQARQGIR